MKLYAGVDFDSWARKETEEIADEIKSQSDSYILNVNVDDYKVHLLQKHRLEIPQIQFDGVYADITEREISTSSFPPEYSFFDRNKLVRTQVIITSNSVS